MSCVQCNDDFCAVCFQHQHRKGNRTKHQSNQISQSSSTTTTITTTTEANSIPSLSTSSSSSSSSSSIPTSQSNLIAESDSELVHTVASAWFGENLPSSRWFEERCHYVPLRLTEQERKYLAIVTGVLKVSEYTDKVDIMTYSSKAARIQVQLEEICSLVMGLMLASDFKEGKKIVENSTFRRSAGFIQQVLEIGRRHKVRNPDKMRELYGKLVYLLMDSQQSEIRRNLGTYIIYHIS